MKKLSLLKSALLLFALIVGSGSLWADTDITLTASSGFGASYGSDHTFTVSGIGFKDSGVMYNGKGTPSGFALKQVIQMRKSGSGAGVIYNTTALSTITSVEITLVNANNGFTLYYGTSENPSTNSIASSSLTPVTGSFSYTNTSDKTTTATSYKFTFDLSSYNATYIKIINGSSANYVGSIKINYTANIWDLSTNSYVADPAPTEDLIQWTSSCAEMKNQRNGSGNTAVNNWIPTTKTSTRFYANNILTITPTSGYAITSIVFTATSDSYATALKNSTWSNASAVASSSTVTVTPTNGALPISATIGGVCGFTEVKVYYGVAATVSLTPAKAYTTLTSSHNLDFTSVSSDLKAYIATEISGGNVQMTQVNKVPAGTGIVLKATTPNSPVNVPVFDGTSPDDVSSNKMTGSATATTEIAANAGYILSNGVFQPASAGTLAAGKAYLNIGVSGAHPLEMNFDNGEVTSISAITNEAQNNGVYYNLNGQRVAQPTKGLYIVNGKKVVIK